MKWNCLKSKNKCATQLSDPHCPSKLKTIMINCSLLGLLGYVKSDENSTKFFLIRLTLRLISIQDGHDSISLIGKESQQTQALIFLFCFQKLREEIRFGTVQLTKGGWYFVITERKSLKMVFFLCISMVVYMLFSDSQSWHK